MIKKYISVFLFIFIAPSMLYANHDDDFWLSWCMGFIEYYILYEPGSPDKDELTRIFEKNPILKERFDYYKKDLEPVIIDKVRSGDTRYVILAAYYKSPSFVEPLVQYFLNNNLMYRWEGPDYESLDTFILDSQYPIQNLCIDIIKSILNTNTVNIILTEEQFKKLHSQYSKYLPIDKNNTISPSEISESLLAYWKFKKLGYDVKLYK